jgi:transcriptional regulator with XRE-family HTH domain
MMDGENSFGQALRSLRLRRNMSQQDFSRVISREHLSRLERGVSQPNLELIRKLAAVLKVHPMSLVAAAFVDGANPVELRALIKIVAQDLRLTKNS